MRQPKRIIPLYEYQLRGTKECDALFAAIDLLRDRDLFDNHYDEDVERLLGDPSWSREIKDEEVRFEIAWKAAHWRFRQRFELRSLLPVIYLPGDTEDTDNT